MNKTLRHALAAAGLISLSAVATAATNVLPAGWTSLTSVGTVGTLRAGSPWGPGASLAPLPSIVDDVFVPESTQWNSGSWWWDQDPSVNASPVVMTIQLDQSYVLDSFVVPADQAGPDGAARFWGLTVTVADLDGAVADLGPLCGSPRDAVQPGRRIATIKREAGLGLPVALITP